MVCAGNGEAGSVGLEERARGDSGPLREARKKHSLSTVDTVAALS